MGEPLSREWLIPIVTLVLVHLLRLDEWARAPGQNGQLPLAKAPGSEKFLKLFVQN